MTILAQSAADPYRFQAHPEVWLLIAGLVVLGAYAANRIGPKVLPSGEATYTRSQRNWFFAGIATLWLVSDWPIHDLAEGYLYSIHMVQHMVITMVVPPMLLMATPRWLAELVVPPGTKIERAVRLLSHPVGAAVVFGATTMLTHWSAIVNLSVENGPFHYLMHVLLVAAAVVVWLPVCSPLKEMRASLPAQMVYLFLMSVPPTVPGAWLTVAEDVVYAGYDNPYRLWGMSVVADQQTAGLIMKLAGGFYLWAIIGVLFFRWSSANQRRDALDRDLRARARFAESRERGSGRAGVHDADETLTFAEVEEQFRHSEPPATEAST